MEVLKINDDDDDDDKVCSLIWTEHSRVRLDLFFSELTIARFYYVSMQIDAAYSQILKLNQSSL